MSNAAVMAPRVSNGGSFDFLDAVATFFGTFGAAVRASHAFDAGRLPDAADLEVLGIDKNAFASIG